MTGDRSERAQYLASIWDQFKDLILERLAAVEKAAGAVQRGALGDDLRRRAAAEAHKLTGSLGSIGFPDGSRIAREIEELLLGDTAVVQTQASRFADLAAALRRELEQGPA